MANENDSKVEQPEEVGQVQKAETVEPGKTEEEIEAPVDRSIINGGSRGFCPNCNSPAIRKGKVIICQVCDASFRWTQEGPKLVELGPFDDHERRIKALEGGPAEPEKTYLVEQPALYSEEYENKIKGPDTTKTAESDDDGI